MTAIELLKPHRHAGRDYLAGQTLRLAPHKADWLIAIGAGMIVAGCVISAGQRKGPPVHVETATI